MTLLGLTQFLFKLAFQGEGVGMFPNLIDTYQKDGRSTVDHLGYSNLSKLHEVARQQNLWWALAGSVRKPIVDELQVLGWMPDCFGVRGDVCSGTRTTRIAHNLVQAWCQRLLA